MQKYMSGICCTGQSSGTDCFKNMAPFKNPIYTKQDVTTWALYGHYWTFNLSYIVRQHGLQVIGMITLL